MRIPALFLVLCWVFIPLAPGIPQESFGFGFSDEPEDPGKAPVSRPSVNITGEVSAQLLGYLDDFTATVQETSWGDIFAGKLNFSAAAFHAEGVVNLKLTPVFDGSASPVALDEAYLRAYFGSFTFEGGLRKLTWGKADSFGPLDVVNPLDYRDLTRITDLMDRKIARPLIRGSYALGDFSKVEGVFIPWFEGHRFADSGRWTPEQLKALTGKHPKTTSLEYAQGGLRFTTTLGSSDLGIQYFCGNLFRPAFTFTGGIDYNRYHQIGADYAQVIAGFNLRGELAAVITGDLSGDDGGVYNPFMGWSLGFDRDLLWGINLNLQAAESVRLLHDKIGDTPGLDTEAGTSPTATRIILILAKKFLRDELELKVTGIWGIEDQDFFIIPGLVWTKWDLSLEVSGGFLGGDEKGELGQYRQNNFIRVCLTYTF